MKRLSLLVVVMMTFWPGRAANGVMINQVRIRDVQIEPNQPTNRDPITIIASGTASSGAVFINSTDFQKNGTSLEIDIFFWLGPYAGIWSWSHSEVIGALPVNSYQLTVRAYSYSELSGKYELTDTYSTSLTVEPGSPIEATVEIEPKTINLQSKGKWINCYIWLPEDYNVADIEPNSVVLEAEPNDIYAEWIWFEEEDEVVMAKFSRSDVQAILEPGEIELTVSGELDNGMVFVGTDVIRVRDKGGRH